jgi:hypothetical protein
MIRLTLILAIVIVTAMIILPPDDPVVDAERERRHSAADRPARSHGSRMR